MTDLVEEVARALNIGICYEDKCDCREPIKAAIAIVLDEAAQWHDKQAAEYNQSRKLYHENGDWHVADMQMAKEEAHTDSAAAIRALGEPDTKPTKRDPRTGMSDD